VRRTEATSTAGRGEATLGADGPGQGSGAGVATVADAVTGLLRTVRRSKARLLAAAGDNIDSAAQGLLRTAAAEGPLRASALAAAVHSDLSTVSRQVAALVTHGLLERRADPVDGRASLLVVTAAGQAVIAEHEHARAAFFEQVLSGWKPGELSQFAGLLRKFTADYDTTHTLWMTDATRHSARTHDSEEGTTV
jgi:DNA-binding MarR family transcriptional regulator